MLCTTDRTTAKEGRMVWLREFDVYTAWRPDARPGGRTRHGLAAGHATAWRPDTPAAWRPDTRLAAVLDDHLSKASGVRKFVATGVRGRILFIFGPRTKPTHSSTASATQGGGYRPPPARGSPRLEQKRLKGGLRKQKR